MATTQAEACEPPARSLLDSRIPTTTASCTLPHNPPRVDAPIKGLIFEIANVLYDATLWWRWLIGLIVRLHPELNQAALLRQWNDEYLVDVRRGRREFGEAFECLLLATGFTRGEVDEMLAAGLSRRRDLEFEVMPFPGVKHTVQRIHRAGVQLAILTDSASTGGELTERLSRWGLAQYFPHVISSLDLGHTKPAACCYELAIAQLALDRSEICFVGQSPDDLAAAGQQGLRTIGVHTANGTTGDFLLPRFDALAELVAPRPSAPAMAVTSHRGS